MRTLLVIGMGAGSPGHITQDAVAALKQADAVVALDKGDVKADLLRLREQIVSTHAPDVPLIAVTDPQRDRNPADYRSEVTRWHAARARLLAETITTHVPDGGTAAFLVWGDPSLYDSTLRVIDRMRRDCALECEVQVFPGITAIQALTAAHAITINRIGEPILVTTARMLPRTPEQLLGNCVVMLDGADGWNSLKNTGTEIFWGAYLGTDKQIIRHGMIDDIGDSLAQLKTDLRREHGWIMDTYLLRR
ncbi:precorrin-6A synthase (deacetylating) [Corynebacterium mendelii]|uniref:Precorrin-6A synthase (Deacetylating) n=1 Tax=Corynebacterium mendelii TaxID=2765362 RepID=A0A939E0H1_9CORY|nr:precorrin-6A synthase (deacetylating) [Corynebacterium mendelii]MBN9644679.1 precorrin-6A synthase (deacetylating) [Corynebacterium mendelii]